MSAYGHGRHEHGQNFLTDHKFINSIIDLVKQTSGPIIEIGPGSGALTHPMAHLGRAITAVEVDAKLAAKLTQETSSATVEVVHDDFLNFRLPATPCVIVGNIPFHLTTAILRKLLHAPAWTDAVLLMQWEVARRRAGVGASTMMTAQLMAIGILTFGKAFSKLFENKMLLMVGTVSYEIYLVHAFISRHRQALNGRSRQR